MPERDEMDPDPNKPVTRGELRQELHLIRTELRQELHLFRQELRQELGQELHLFRQELRQELRQEFVTKNDLASFEQRLFAELARHSLANKESLSADVAVVDEQYRDLPARVTRLEEAVFKPPRKRARRS